MRDAGHTDEPFWVESGRSDTENEIVDSTEEVSIRNVDDSGIKGPDDAFQYGNQDENGDKYANTEAAALRPAADTLFGDVSLYGGNISQSQTYNQISTNAPSSSTSVPGRMQFTLDSSHPAPRWKNSIIWNAWLQGKGMLMVILSQFFGSSMNVMTQVLERDGVHGKAMHPFQILFSRMIITVAASSLYMWYAQVPNPFGSRGIRGLLMLRAAGGFFGVCGMYFSLLYMPLSEATVLTFLAPIVACYACSFLMPNEPFTRKQQLAGIISLLGVVLIARPFSSGKVDGVSDIADIAPLAEDIIDGVNNSTSLTSLVIAELSENDLADGVSIGQHLMAIGFGLVGVLGAACAYVTIRLIGPRAHPLVSVTYFSTYTTTVSLIAMIAIPSVSFRLPGNLMEWGLLLGLGATGFMMQFLLTAGLSYQPPSGGGKPPQKGNGTRATSMLYTQMLFALFYDKVVMDSSPSAISWAGSGLILGSALYVGVIRDSSSSGSNGARSNTTMAQEGVTDDEAETGRAKNTTTLSSRDMRDVEEGRGLLAESDALDAEASSSS